MTMRLVYSQYNSEAPTMQVENPTYDPKEQIKKDLIDKIENDELIKYAYYDEEDGTQSVKAEIKFYRIYENIKLEDSSTGTDSSIDEDSTPDTNGTPSENDGEGDA